MITTSTTSTPVRRHLARAAVLATLAGGLVAAQAVPAHSFTFPVVGTLTVSKVEYKGTQLRLEGQTLTGVSYIDLQSTTSVTSTRADASGRFKLQSDTFTSPDCTAVLRDYYHAPVTVTLPNCRPTA